MAYPCTMCGCCCRKIEVVIKLTEGIEDEKLRFPFQPDKEGVCEKFNKQDNTCSIYETRPLICDIDRMAEYFDVDKKSFYTSNIKACNEMMDMDGVDKKLRIQ